jgi:hypothetical protein
MTTKKKLASSIDLFQSKIIIMSKRMYSLVCDQLTQNVTNFHPKRSLHTLDTQ